MDYQVTPVPLNAGEAQFVQDVQTAWDNNVFPAGAEVFLLRNIAGKGAVGVFVDGGFEPDFILWVKHQGEQQVVFIDPKGLRHHSFNDPKVNFYRTIKELERSLHTNNPSMRHIKLHSFLVSQTHAAILEGLWRVTREEIEDKNILFPNGDGECVETLVQRLFA